MRIFQLLVFSLFLQGCQELQEGDAWKLTDAEVISIQRGLPHCGIVYSLTEMQFRDKGGRSRLVYLPCVEMAKKPLPNIGEICSAKGLFETKSGSIQMKGFDEKPIWIARELSCGDEVYDFSMVVG